MSGTVAERPVNLQCPPLTGAVDGKVVERWEGGDAPSSPASETSHESEPMDISDGDSLVSDEQELHKSIKRSWRNVPLSQASFTVRKTRRGPSPKEQIRALLEKRRGTYTVFLNYQGPIATAACPPRPVAIAAFHALTRPLGVAPGVELMQAFQLACILEKFCSENRHVSQMGMPVLPEWWIQSP
ncbi:hypothetical protein Micbo1qcDRAFT_180671 [Microdochium bolleyi]|uniref:Uncharacterized protein n=1 Tax=Microdochium bolleyi TaxID=196109 RepID=A0A136IL10_9PEZI|nr:hypothetical protein Micbo1qcDRAFT_180671 [Microdochium bolleyi]